MTETEELVAAIYSEDVAALAAVREALPAIAEAARRLSDRLRRGGRCFYAGAGTSGRLGVLDASELPPTFGISADRVIALIAGGPAAITEAIEGAEDDFDAAERDLAAHGFDSADAVLAIAASGATPYARGALAAGRARGALTLALIATAGSPMIDECDLPIVVATGREIITGSTRMKAGTAQKVALHTLSTATMAALGLVHAGEMVAMRPTNDKLRARAVRIVRDLTSVPEERARELLEECAHELPIALLRARFGESTAAARERLAIHNGSVDAAMRSPK
jgi:N-acetylmuramic acid 6-phosphate etherase